MLDRAALALIGDIGGRVVDGLLGLFIGPVLLAVAYMLFMEWLRGQQVPSSIDTESAPS